MCRSSYPRAVGGSRRAVGGPRWRATLLHGRHRVQPQAFGSQRAVTATFPTARSDEPPARE